MSSEGTLVYVPGTAATDARPIDWLTRDGKTAVLRATNADWANPRFSPDGQKLAVEIFDGTQRDVWVYEWARDTLTQLTFDPGQDRDPVWTPDGRRLVFASDRAKVGTANLYWVNADATGEVTRLSDSPDDQRPFSWHPSGRSLTFRASRPGTGQDLLILPMEGDATRGWTPGTPTVLLGTPANETWPMFSPDGRWIAYSSTEARSVDIYVRPFPGRGGPWRISTTGGRFPRWSATAPELLFLSQENSINNVFVVDAQPPSLIAAWMSAAHTLVLPSLSEGQPTVVMEAMALGLPVLATDIPGTRELVQPGKTGFLFPPRDFAGLAGCLENFIKNEPLRQQMGCRAKEYIKGNGLHNCADHPGTHRAL